MCIRDSSCSDGSHLFVCVKCRYRSTGARVDGLGKLCNDRPPRHAEYSWRGLCRGIHPNPRKRDVT
eukprot:8288661-Pyramimonas_sp.AAC.1